MEYIKATEHDLEQIATLVKETIQTIYPKYYPMEVVDFFCQLHCKDNILKDIQAGLVGVLKQGHEIIGTGCFNENHITRVYVKPAFQKQGYGSYIMQCLENEIGLQYETVCLDASLPASRLYENRGYRTIKHERWNVENGVVLVYEIMEKYLTKSATNMYHQNDNIVLANYDARISKIEIKPKNTSTKVVITSKMYDESADKKKTVKITFSDVAAVDFRINYFDNMIGAEAFGLYEIKEKNFIKKLVKEIFERRKEIYLLEGNYDYDANEPNDMLNILDLDGSFMKNIDSYCAYVQNVDAGVYIIVAKRIEVIDSLQLVIE